MPCDNRKCSLGLASKNLDANKSVFCEFQKCCKKFCNEKCLQIHFIEEHNFLNNNKKYFNYNDLSATQKKLLKKTIEHSICGNFIEDTLTTHKKRIASELNELVNSKNLQIKFEQIENDYNNLEYFYYFHYKNFDNPHSPNANFSSTASSSLNKTGNFGNSSTNAYDTHSNNYNHKNNDNHYNNHLNNSNNLNNNNNLIFPCNNSRPTINNNNTTKESSKSLLPKQFTKIIGSGAFGDVYLVKNTLDGKLFAIKQLSREKVKENGIDSEIVYREINTHFKLIHNNIARLYDYYEDKKAYYLIMEFVDNGTLFNKIQKANGLPEEKALKYFVQVSSAIFFLHENQLIHRDIKPENCLIDKNDNVKLCDFGWTVEISKGERITFCGTYEYMAPEIIKEIPYNHMIDVWSLGVLLYELNHSFSPFRAKQNKNNPLKYDPNNQIMNNIIKNKFEFEKDMSNECKDLIARILNPDCGSRLTLKDIFTHPYLMNYFISNMNLKVTKMFDVLESALLMKKFIFIKFFTSAMKKKTTAKAENSTLFEDMEISINKSLRTKYSTNDLNTFTASCNSKGEFTGVPVCEKNIEHKILNLRKNNFFFKAKSEFFSKLKKAAKPLKEKEILLNNLNSIIKENNSLLMKTKNKSFTNDHYDDNANNEICNFESIENKILFKRKNTDENLDPNTSNNFNFNSFGSKEKHKSPFTNNIKENLNNNSNPQNKNPLKSILVNKNSEFLEEVLDKIQNKRSAKHDSLDLDHCDIAIKKDLLNNSKNNNSNNNNNYANNSLKKKKSSKRSIKNLILETQQILNGALASSTNSNNNNSKNFNDLNNSANNLLLNELSKSSEKIGRRVLFPNNNNNKSFNEQQHLENNLLISNNSSIRIICDKANNNNDNNGNCQNRCSSIKELNNISNSSYSLMKEIKDINTVIEHKNKKIENFIETKNNMKKVLEENLNNSNSHSKNNFTIKDNLNPSLNNNNNNANNNKNNIFIYNSNGSSKNNNNFTNINNQTEETGANINSSAHYRKASEIKDFNINDINLNSSKMSDLRICKNIHLSLLENSLLSAIKKDSPDLTHNFSNKNILHNLNNNLINNNNNNEIIIISSTRNDDGKNGFDNNNNYYLINESLSNFAISDKSLLKISHRENNESQNFWFAINNKEKSNLNKSQEYNEEQSSVLSGKSNNKNNEAIRSKNLNKTNTSLGNTSYNNNNNLRLNNSKANESFLAPEKVKEFSLISNKDDISIHTKHKSHKSINNSKISSDSGCEESKNFGNSLKKNSKTSKNNNNSLVSHDKNYANRKSLKKNPNKICKQFTNSSNGNGSWELKNNIMKIRKNNRKSINKKYKESSRLIKIKDFEEILVDNNNKSFEEKTENCSMWKNFFGFFNVFKCGAGGNAN